MLARSVLTLGKFRRAAGGNVGSMFAMVLLPMALAVGGAVDYARWFRTNGALQTAADAAVLAAASASSVTDLERTELASAFFKANFDAAVFGATEPAVTSANGVVSLATNMDVPTTFLKLANIASLPAHPKAAAAVSGGGGYACMLALSEHGADTIHVQGSNNLAVHNCWAWTNSDSSEAITGSGGATARASGFCAAGGFEDSGNYQPVPVTNCQRLADPYRDLWTSAPSDCDYNNKKVSNGNVVLNPGRYCGGLELKPQATVTFQPGVYWIKGGSLTFQAGSTAYGDDVVFIFTGSNTRLELLGGANTQLKGRKSGTYAGFLFVQDRYSNPGETSKIQGGGSIQLDGVLYMPTQTVQVGGNGDFNANAKLFALVASSFDLRGNGTLGLNGDYEAAGLPNILPRIPGETHVMY